MEHVPSGNFSANSAWLQCAVLAHNLIRWTATLGAERPVDQLTVARTVRTRLVAIPGRLVNLAGTMNPARTSQLALGPMVQPAPRLRLWCVYCGHDEDNSEFLTQQQCARVMRAAGDYAMQLVGQTLDHSFGQAAHRSHGTRTGGSLACQSGSCTGEAATFKARARLSGRAPLSPERCACFSTT